jgi:hypothetical protein
MHRNSDFSLTFYHLNQFVFHKCRYSIALSALRQTAKKVNSHAAQNSKALWRN